MCGDKGTAGAGALLSAALPALLLLPAVAGAGT